MLVQQEDLTSAIPFFADILNFYPSEIVVLPDVRELDHNTFELMKVILEIMKNREFLIQHSMMCVLSTR